MGYYRDSMRQKMNAVILTFMIIFGQFGVGYTACQSFMSVQEKSTTISMNEKSSSCHLNQCASRCERVRHEIFLTFLKDNHKTFVSLLQVVLRVDSIPVEGPASRLVLGRPPIPGPDGLGVDVYLLNSSFLI